MHKNKGFTLIELMIVVAIIAILAAITITKYKEYVDRRQAGGSGTQTEVVSASAASSTLVCSDTSGKEVKNIPAIPGQRWYFEGGSYVTTDANGNPVTESAVGLSCSVK